jgi:hypothetical protein
MHYREQQGGWQDTMALFALNNSFINLFFEMPPLSYVCPTVRQKTGNTISF